MEQSHKEQVWGRGQLSLQGGQYSIWNQSLEDYQKLLTFSQKTLPHQSVNGNKTRFWKDK